jgi:cytochrome bd-type quinol oxidase subunit 1
MVGSGFQMALLALYGLYLGLRKLQFPAWYLRVLPFAIALPYLANSSG